MKSWLTRTFQVFFAVLVVGIAGTSIANAATIAVSVNPSFRADLMNTLKPQTGTGSITYTRATTATVVDFEGLVRPVLSGEARFVGARRVQNFCKEDLVSQYGNGTGTTIVGGIADPNGGTTAYRITATVGSGSGQRYSVVTNLPIGSSVRNSTWVRRVSGTGPLYMFNGKYDGSYTTYTTEITTSWQRIATPVQTTTDIYTESGWRFETNGDAIDVWHAQTENVTGQANQNPSEYVSKGVLQAPYNGANIDGVQYFKTLNGNTVNANSVVSQSTGAAITSSTAKYGQIPGTSGNYFSTPDSVTNSITGDIDMRVYLKMDSWTPAATTIVSKDGDTDRGYRFNVNANGTLGTGTSATGGLPIAWSDSTVPTGFKDGTAHWIRATIDVNNGAGGFDVTFYTSENGTTWTQLGAVVTTAGVTSIWDSSWPLELGGLKQSSVQQMAGRIYRVQIYRGINGILAVDFNPNSWTSGSTWRSLTGETWTMNGSASVFGGTGVWDSTGPLGFLSEGARTNLFTYSEQFDNAAWSKAGATVTANATTSPDGTTSADKLVEDSSSGGHSLIGGPGSTSGHTYTISLYAKAAERSAITLGASTLILGGGAGIAFSLTGAGSVIGAPVNCTGTINNVGNGWYRVTMTLTATLTGGGGIFINVSDGTYLANYQGNGTSGVYIWGASMEDSAGFASSYIPTTSGSVTRNADVLRYPATGNVNPLSGSYYFEFTSGHTAVDGGENDPFSIDGNGTQIFLGSGDAYIYTKNRVDNVQVNLGYTIVPRTLYNFAGKWVTGGQYGGTINGSALTTGTQTNTSSFSYITVGSNTGTSQLHGTMRNVRVWKKSLTNAQLSTFTTNNNPLAKALIPQTTVKTPTKNGLVSQWTFSEGSGTKTNDTSGLGNNGTLVNSPAWITGKVGKALNFNGTTNYVSLTRSPFSGTSFSIAGWVKLSALQDKKFISALDVVLSTQTKGVAFGVNTTLYNGINANSLVLQTGRPSWAWSVWSSPTNSLTQINQWYHVGVTVTAANTATPSVTFYINGVPQTATVWSSGQDAINYGNTDASARIGGVYTASSPAYDTQYFNGATDDLQVYNRALTATEMANLAKSTSVVVNTLPATSGSGLVGLWSFDGKDMNWTTNQALDKSGSGNNGTLMNMSTTTSPVIGKIGQGLRFDGSTQYVSTGTGLGLSGDFSGTISAWVKRSSGTGTQTVYVAGSAVTLQSFALGINQNSAGDVTVQFNGGRGRYSAGGLIPLNVWTYLTVTKTPGPIESTSHLYINGVEVAQAGGQTGTPNFAASLSYMGTWTNKTAYFNGMIDDLRVYNRALSATEVKALYNSGR